MVNVTVAIDGSEHVVRALSDAVGLIGNGADSVLVSVVPSSMLSSIFGSAATGTSPQGGTGSGGMPLVRTPEGDDLTG